MNPDDLTPSALYTADSAWYAAHLPTKTFGEWSEFVPIKNESYNAPVGLRGLTVAATAAAKQFNLLNGRHKLLMRQGRYVREVEVIVCHTPTVRVIV